MLVENIGEGSSIDNCSELEGSDNDRDWLLLLLVSLLKTGDWLLPVLWIGLEVQSSTGCFFWTSEVKKSKQGSRGDKWGDRSKRADKEMMFKQSNLDCCRHGNLQLLRP